MRTKKPRVRKPAMGLRKPRKVTKKKITGAPPKRRGVVKAAGKFGAAKPKKRVAVGAKKALTKAAQQLKNNTAIKKADATIKKAKLPPAQKKALLASMGGAVAAGLIGGLTVNSKYPHLLPSRLSRGRGGN